MPQLGETVSEGTVTAWHKKVGDKVERDETLFDVSTDKVDTEVPSPQAGVLTAILVEEGATVPVGTTLAVIETSGAAATPLPNPPPQGGREPAASVFAASIDTAPASTRTNPPPPLWGRVGEGDKRNRDSKGRPLSPAVRRLAKERGVDPAMMQGSGADGRVTRRDLEAKAPTGAAGDERIPFSRIRKLTAEHMVRSKATSPHVLQAVEAEFHRVDRARAAHGEAWRTREGFALTYLPFVARAACLAIADFPRVNASVEGETLVVHKAVHLGIAVDLGSGDGLVVPVIRDAATKGVPVLAREIHRLAQGARAGKLGADDCAGGTYTISNSGSFGTLITAPIIAQPQVAILSTDGVKKKPVVVEGPDGDAIVIRPVGVIAQSFDHRAIDGAYSAAFLRRVKEIVETRDWIADFS
jgi:2-oxoglutarate dehydrogenase E2 component (dihydrolipoamide succinyltransferase)